MFLKGFDWFC